MKCTLRIFSLCCVDLGKHVRATDIYLGHKTALSHSHIDRGSKAFQYGTAQGHYELPESTVIQVHTCWLLHTAQHKDTHKPPESTTIQVNTCWLLHTTWHRDTQ